MDADDVFSEGDVYSSRKNKQVDDMLVGEIDDSPDSRKDYRCHGINEEMEISNITETSSHIDAKKINMKQYMSQRDNCDDEPLVSLGEMDIRGFTEKSDPRLHQYKSSNVD